LTAAAGVALATVVIPTDAIEPMIAATTTNLKRRMIPDMKKPL